MKVSKRDRLVELLGNLSPEMRDHLKKSKADGLRNAKRADFVWHFLLLSFSTWGNSRGAQGLIRNRDNYSRVTFDALSRLSPRERRRTLEYVLRRAVVRMPVKKAELLSKNFERVKELGGLKAARTTAMAERGTAAKIAFMKTFHGIGKKYARNIWMDIYHPEFRTTIAVDERIKKVSKHLGVSFSNYEEHEAFYQAVAAECGLEPWELDRLLYKFGPDIIEKLT